MARHRVQGMVGMAVVAVVVLGGGGTPTASSAPDLRCGPAPVPAPATLHADAEGHAPLAPPSTIPAPGPADATSGGSVEQQIGVTILGGPLELRDPARTVALTGDGSRTLVGAVDPITVVDARGTHAGWTVRWHASSLHVGAGDEAIEGAVVVVEPAGVVPVHGFAEGLEAGPTCTGAGEVGRALPGSGGGTFEAGATVTVTLPPGATADRGTLSLELSVS